MDLDAIADAAQQREGELATEMLPELVQSGEQSRCAQRLVPQRQAEPAEQGEDGLDHRLVAESRELRVDSVDRDADGDRFAVPERAGGHRLQLVSRPVAEIERAGAAHLERITGGRDVGEVDRCAPPDQLRERLARAGRERRGVLVQPAEELGIADQRDFYRLGLAGDRVAPIERFEESLVAQHRPRRRERAEEVLRAEQVHAVLHADARVRLREHRGRNTHDTQPAVRRRGSPARHVEQRSAADDEHERVTIEPERVNALMECGGTGRIALRRLAAGQA